jgi:DNA polymerase alpha subunit B
MIFILHISYPQPPLIDLLRNDAELQLPGPIQFEYGSLGLQHIENAGRESSRSKAVPSRRVHSVPNPCTLKLNEITIGISSTDALLHLSSEETNANLEPGTRLTRLASHFIRQRSYYPLFPVSSTAGMDISMDLSKNDLWELPCQPDILLLPSKLASFCKCIFDKTVVMTLSRT